MAANYATILLPLAAEGSFTYKIPPELASNVRLGSRVVVQFGARHYYTGIVITLHEQNPIPGHELKDIKDVADPMPAVLPLQLRLWQWVSDYYMCTPGEVMKAALPSGLKIESETRVMRNDGFDASLVDLSETEECILHALDKGCTITELGKRTKRKNIVREVRRMMDKGMIIVRETVNDTFRPRTETHVRLNDDFFSEEKLNIVFSQLSKSPAQTALLTRYLDISDAPAALTQKNASLLKEVNKQELCNGNRGDAALSALRKRGILISYPFTISRLNGVARPVGEEARRDVSRQALSPLQQQAHDDIIKIFQERQVCLLHGVTSSGKTEVYIKLIEEAIANGRQVLYLLPEIALTTQITKRLGRIFGKKMGVYHSKFPDAERVELWKRQLTPQAFPLILGARSSIFLPFQNLGLVIVDEEHDQSYKQQDPAPRYQARDTATMLAHLCGAKVLLGTATPSLETYHNATTGKYGIVRMFERFGGVKMPEIKVEDVKELRRKKMMFSPFSPKLIEAIRNALDSGRQAIIFQNRRGWSPVLECRACGWTPHCTKCDVSLTFHQSQNRLVCHYCGTTYDVPRKCPACGSTELRDMGFGTEKIESEARRIFPNARTARLDLDTSRSRTAYEKIIAAFSRGETNLLIGTQMVTKGLDFDGVTVVGILSADQMLNQPDYRATERAYQMMRQVAGRAGRRKGRGLVVLQTSQAALPIIDQIVRGDYTAMYHEQMEERTTFGFPPSSRLICILLRHRNESVVVHAAEEMATMLRPHFGAGLLGPDRPLVSRVQLLFIRKIFIKASPSLPISGIRRTLLAARDVLLNKSAYKSVNILFDVDP